MHSGNTFTVEYLINSEALNVAEQLLRRPETYIIFVERGSIYLSLKK